MKLQTLLAKTFIQLIWNKVMSFHTYKLEFRLEMSRKLEEYNPLNLT